MLRENLNKTGIYKITNLINKKVYIGSAATSFRQRWNEHRTSLNTGKHYNRHLLSAWKKYGREVFRFDILCFCKPEDCITEEQRFIDKYNSYKQDKGYNICPIAGKNVLGMKHAPDAKSRSQERREAISNRIKECWADPEYKKRMSKQIREITNEPERRRL